MKNTYFTSFKGIYYKKLQETAASFFVSCCFTSTLISADIIFTTFYNFVQHYLKKEFRHKFPIFNGFTQIPPLNGQNLLSVTKGFSRGSVIL